MGIISSRTTRAWRQQRCAARGLLLVLTALLSPVNTMSPAARKEPGPISPRETSLAFPDRPSAASPRARAADQRDALPRPREPDDRPHLGLSVRGLETGHGKGALSP